MLSWKGLHKSFFSGGEREGGVCVHSDVCGSFHRDVSVYARRLKITFHRATCTEHNKSIQIVVCVFGKGLAQVCGPSSPLTLLHPPLSHRPSFESLCVWGGCLSDRTVSQDLNMKRPLSSLTQREERERLHNTLTDIALCKVYKKCAFI